MKRVMISVVIVTCAVVSGSASVSASTPTWLARSVPKPPGWQWNGSRRVIHHAPSGGEFFAVS